MAIRRIRLDDETEALLRQIRKETGLPISEVLKRGLRALREQVHPAHKPTAYDIYKSLQVHPGGWSIDSSDQVHRGVRSALKKKLRH